MYRDVSSCNTYNYGDAMYWNARYIQEGGSFDWYQRYSALRPFIRNFIPLSSRVLMVGCGNAVMSEDMVKDGYEDIMNIDISSVAIDMMQRKYEYIPQLKYMQMDVRDMSFFPDESFDGVIDKGISYSIHVVLMLQLVLLRCLQKCVGCIDLNENRSFEICTEVLIPVLHFKILTNYAYFLLGRLLKPGGTYILITYGDPTVRMPHISRPVFNWKITLYNIPRPGFQKPESSSPSRKSYMEPIPLTEKGLLPADMVLEDPDSHYIYVCKKINDTEIDNIPAYQLTADVL
ncbi:hypothetical protein Fmac_022743 [Flemingia macrophylla]|uniref:Methyltransferase domain-containing protein n=1 Tax=Flemingia macrophylla TaxID=520843 RepID=A0ABD1M0R4_9FABA